MLREPPGQIITFYSYKGGTGRTMALANVACVLAKKQEEDKGKGVLMIDWDLEAPGLYRFFQNAFTRRTSDEANPDAWLERQDGLLDLFWELDQATRQYGDGNQRQVLSAARGLLDEFRPEQFILPTDIPGLSLLKAGRFDDNSQYSERVNTFRWEAFYNRAPWLIQSFAERLSKLYRYVLIDSRTGLTDVSGICTMLLPEKLVLVFTPNRQSIEGGLRLIERATTYRRQSSDLRPLVIFPLASRVDPAREQLRNDWRLGNKEKGIQGFQYQFQDLFRKVYQVDECNLKDYFEEVQIQHNSDYAYGETIAVQVERDSEDRLSLARSYRTFTERLINSVSPWQSTARNVLQLNQELSLRSVPFPNGNRAQLMRPPPDSNPKDIIRALYIKKASALIIIVGRGESPMSSGTARLSPLLSTVLARVASDAEALILDDGTRSGVAEMVGQAAADRGRDIILLGVAPAARVMYPDMPTSEGTGQERVPLDPNHTHFVLVEGQEWEDGLNTKYELAKELAQEIPVVTLLAGDGSNAQKELHRIVQQRWPIIVLEGTSRLADDLAALSRAKNAAHNGENLHLPHRTPRQASDPWVAEIVGEGQISAFPSHGSNMDFTRMVYRNLPPGKALESAWSDVAAYDRGAMREQRRVGWLQLAFLSLGVLGMIAALGPMGLELSGYGELTSGFRGLLRVLVTVLPLAAYFTFAMLDFYGPEKYARLRRTAEAIRREIFQYRSRIGSYSSQQTVTTPREIKLAEKVKEIEKEALPLGVQKPPAPDMSRIPRISSLDDGFSPLSPERYIATRLTHQAEYYEHRERRLTRGLMLSRLLMILLLATGSVLLVLNFTGGGEAWGPLAIATAFALMAYTGVRQVDQPRVCRMVATNLASVRFWWTSLSPDEKADQKNIDRLVYETENTLEFEWRESLPYGGFHPAAGALAPMSMRK